MKKSLNSALLRFLMMGGVVICIVFTACENFLDGAVLKKSVEKEIEWEKAESLSVLVTPEEGTGSTVPFGNYDCKLGYFFEVSFTENNSYSFIKWAAVSADNLSEEIEGVLFEDASSPKTTVKFARPIANVRILPVCTQRIAVSGEPSPRYEPNGVARDRSISVTFTKELSEENFIFQPEELPQGATAQTDDDGKIWAYVSGNQTFLKNISITNADDFSIAEHFSRPQVTGRLLTIPVDKTKPIQFNSGEVFKTIKVTLSKEISDSDNIKMNYSKNWNYLITEATDEKATVNLSGNSSEGSVYLAGTKDYSLGQKITLAFTENTDWQFIKWDYDSSVIYIDNPESINTTAVVIEKTTEDNPTQIRAVCARRLRLAENGYEPKTTGNETVSKNSSIQLTFDQNLPADAEDLAQLANLSITVGGTPVRSCFNAPVISGNTVSFTADKSNMLDVTEGQTKTVTVTIPADFYYKLDDGTKVTWGGNGFAFDYRIDSTTTQKASVVFEMETDSGTITPAAGLHEYSEGQEVAVSFVPADGWEFRGWTVKTGAGDDVPASKIKILDPDALSTKLIVYEALSDVKVRADAVLLPAVSSFTPAYESGGKDCDTPVVIIFNKAMKTDTFNLYSEADAQGMKGTIQIVNPSNEYEHYEEYFNAPSWSADGKTLTLKPKNTIRDALVKNDSDLRNIRIVFDISKVSDTDGNKLKEADASWVYRINHSMETIAPTVEMKLYKRGFNIQEDSTGEYTTVENSTYTELSISQFSSFTTNDFSKNHVGAKIYFDATVSDEGSGYKQLTIQETLISTVDATTVEQKCTPKILADESFTKKDYELQSLFDGVVQLDFVFEDYAGSKATRTWYVIKDTTLDSGKVLQAYHFNSLSRFSDGDKITEILDYSKYTDNQDKYYDNKREKCTIQLFWGYDNTYGTFVEPNENNILTFDRDISKNCYLLITAIDSVGNVKTIRRIIPKQFEILDTYSVDGNNHYINYKDRNSFGRFAKENNCDVASLVYCTYKENENAEETSIGSFDLYRLLNSTSFKTDKSGIYKVYLTVALTYSEGTDYFGPFSKPYVYYHEYTPSSSTTETPPDFPTSFEIIPENNPAKNVGYVNINIRFPDGFNKSDGYDYGVYWSDGYSTCFENLNFKCTSNLYRNINLYAANKESGNVYKDTSLSKVIDTRNIDNLPPRFSSLAMEIVSRPNKLVIANTISDEQNDLYKNLNGEYEMEYYLIKKNDVTVAFNDVTEDFIASVSDKKITATYDKNYIVLNYDSFVESYYVLTLNARDNVGNYKLYSKVVSNRTTSELPKLISCSSNEDKYNIKFSLPNMPQSTYTSTGNACFQYLDSNSNWKNYIIAYKTKVSGNECTVSDMSTGKNCFVELSNFNGSQLDYKSTFYTYFLPAYELKSASEKAACCKSKSVIPGLGGAYQVYYDAPCFAHTMAFPTDMLGDLDAKLAEAKSIDSTVDDETYIKAIWETKGREYGLKLINSAWLDSASTATYTAPVSEIPAGYSYVTIFHFADGTSVMSEVKQK